MVTSGDGREGVFDSMDGEAISIRYSFLIPMENIPALLSDARYLLARWAAANGADQGVS